jgi:hypothetical protein
MKEEKKPVLAAILIIIIITALVSAYWLNEIPIGRLISSNDGNSEQVYKARFYFLVLSGIGIIITQNFFIHRGLKQKGDQNRLPSDESAQDKNS